MLLLNVSCAESFAKLLQLSGVVRDQVGRWDIDGVVQQCAIILVYRNSARTGKHQRLT